jgi:glycine cleavage system transcriptional repressor
VSRMVVSVVGADRPGIVAAVTGVLRDRGANVEDIATTVLGGHGAVLLVVETDHEPDDLRTALASAAASLDLEVVVAPAVTGQSPPEPTHVLSVSGRDQPGILAEISGVLAGLGANITDLATRTLPPEEAPVRAIVVEMILPDSVDEARVEAAVTEAGAKFDVEHTLRRVESEAY